MHCPKKLVVAIALVAIACCTWKTAVASLSECIDATCRITHGNGSRGSGCTFAIAGGQVYILTAAHVVEGGSAVACEFWRAGHQSLPLAGRVAWRSPAADLAVVAVAADDFAGALPTAIPLAPRDCVIRPGAALTSVGCANGTWATGWRGHAVRQEANEIRFLPAPANGRSGSALFDADARQIVGVVCARAGNDSEGIAASLRAIHDGLARSDGPKQGSVLPREGSDRLFTQCGPQGCLPQSPSARGHLLPLLPLRPLLGGEAKPPYPTLPAQPLDVKPLDDKLGRIAELLGELKADRGRFHGEGDKGAMSGEAADAQARKAAQDAQQGAAQALDAAKAAQAEAAKLVQQTEAMATQLRDVSTQAGRIGANQEKLAETIQRHGTLGERVEMLKQKVDEKVGEDASKPERVRAFVHEVVSDKTEWLRIGLIVALALPLLIFVIDFAHHRRSGDPLLIEKAAVRLAAAATHQPWLVPAAKVAGRAARNVGGLAARMRQGQGQPAADPTDEGGAA